MGATDSRGPYSFPRSARLTRGVEYGRVFRGAGRVADRYFTVLVLGNDAGGARLGMAVSRRIAPRAVDRNRIKRLVRESFRHRRGELGSCDVVVIAKAPARHATGKALHGSLTSLWQRVSKRCQRS